MCGPGLRFFDGIKIKYIKTPKEGTRRPKGTDPSICVQYTGYKGLIRLFCRALLMSSFAYTCWVWLLPSSYKKREMSSKQP